MDAALVPADPQNHANPLIATTTTTRRAVTWHMTLTSPVPHGTHM